MIIPCKILPSVSVMFPCNFFSFVQNNFPSKILPSVSAMLTHLKMDVTPRRSKRGPPNEQSASAWVVFVDAFCNEMSISTRAMLLTMVLCVRGRVFTTDVFVPFVHKDKQMQTHLHTCICVYTYINKPGGYEWRQPTAQQPQEYCVPTHMV